MTAVAHGSPDVAVSPADAAGAVWTPTSDTPDASQALYEKAPAYFSKDGALVPLEVVNADGARGEPNLLFEVRDCNDKTIQRGGAGTRQAGS